MKASYDRIRAQREASRHIVSICDLCGRASLSSESEDYKPVSEKICRKVFCCAYGQDIPRSGPSCPNSCELFSPDLYRIRSVMAHMALENAQGLAALEALLNG